MSCIKKFNSEFPGNNVYRSQVVFRSANARVYPEPVDERYARELRGDDLPRVLRRRTKTPYPRRLGVYVEVRHFDGENVSGDPARKY